MLVISTLTVQIACKLPKKMENDKAKIGHIDEEATFIGAE